ncbi:MAG: hypothetical protein RLY74_872 [Actinomycetota bacterium]|jgi:hypothetical protein
MIRIENEIISYDLNWLENLGAFGRDPKAKLSNLVSIKRAENPWSMEVLRGMRAPGTGLPFLIMLGSMRYLTGKDFCVIYKRRPVLILEFKDEKFKRWIIPANSFNEEALSRKGIR